MNFKIESTTNITSSVSRVNDFGSAEIYKLNLKWDKNNIKPNDKAKVYFEYPMAEITNVWLPNSAPLFGLPRAIKPSWKEMGIVSSIAVSAPVMTFYDNADKNHLTIALSETKKTIRFNFGTEEKAASLGCSFEISLIQYTDTDETELYLFVDKSDSYMYESIENVIDWWENEIEIKPMNVPDSAFDPLYSFWYSYHQDVYEKDVEDECQYAKDFGFKNVIVDDGWQTDDNNGGYAYCGDWEVCNNKFSDFAAHVKRVHDMGLKYILWFSVPFVGEKSKNWNRFKDMILYKNKVLGAGVLDPRYKEVRDFLTSLYKDAVTEWDLDGFKLDFIDSFSNPDNIPANEKMDIPDLQDAIDALMVNIRKELTSIKSDILIEFRQKYIGPNIRKYGNMLRAADCPYDYLSNRISTLDLRLSSGETAVHSDMLMWNNDEKPEVAAIQIINSIFSVVQISVKLNDLPESHKKMLRFWVKFMDENKDLLLRSKLIVREPHMYYTSATAYDEKREISAVYSNDKCIEVNHSESVIINGTARDYIILSFSEQGKYNFKVLDCMGNTVDESTIDADEKLQKINVPTSGMIELSIVK